MEQQKPTSPTEPSDDDRADAVIAADDTGLVGGEQEIVSAEIAQALAQSE